jgi:uncharacterized protein (TIGR02391 family)
MNLETSIDAKLWGAVRVSVESRRFCAAVLDAIHLLTDIIRDRSGLDGDGVALVGQAFGGSSPKLKVTPLRTETERNIQSGVEALLRGLYQAIRNPRSHEAHEDSQQDAEALIIFIDYLLRVVDKAGSPFSVTTLVARVREPDFVPENHYAELLVAEIPAKKHLATCQELFARRQGADPSKVKFFLEAVLNRLSNNDLTDLTKMLSEELRQTTDFETIVFVVKAFPPRIWQQIDEVARLRIENKLIKSVEEGAVDESDRCISGQLGAWAINILDVMTRKQKLLHAVKAKIGRGDSASQGYALRFFGDAIRENFPAPSPFFAASVVKGLENGDIRLKQAVEKWLRFYPGSGSAEAWSKAFQPALANFKARIDEAEIPF